MLEKTLGRHAERAFALLRIVSGLMFSFHGMQKIFGILTEHPQPPVASQIWFGGMIELVCGLAIAFGLATRLAAFLASGTMAVAYVQFHWRFKLGTALLPGINQGEMAALYCFLFLYLACHGAGPWSVDAARRRR
jgi:putative oxidoreductase